MGELLTHLTALAASLGIDVSELDDPSSEINSDINMSEAGHLRQHHASHALAAAAPHDST